MFRWMALLGDCYVTIPELRDNFQWIQAHSDASEVPLSDVRLAGLIFNHCMHGIWQNIYDMLDMDSHIVIEKANHGKGQPLKTPACWLNLTWKENCRAVGSNSVRLEVSIYSIKVWKTKQYRRLFSLPPDPLRIHRPWRRCQT